MAYYPLVGNDVSAYLLTANGQDGNPGFGSQYNFLGVWKTWELNIDFTRAVVKPSQQLLNQKRLTGIDWSINVEHLLVSGGGWIGNVVFNGQFNLRMIFQEENGGGYYTAIGGISKGSIKRGEDGGMESFTVENIGPVGNSGSSIWYTFPASFAPVSTIQQAPQILNVSTVPTSFGSNFLTPGGVALLPGGLQHP